jgi:nucleotide-binding universal stress UspA family protein
LINADAVVRQGNPSQEIAKVARSLDVDLIVIATHGYTGLKHVYLGSVAEKITRHATCPVLVVRNCEHDFA